MPQVFDNDDSGMYFIRDNAFRIEKSDVHEKVKSNGVKVVEFIRIIENQLHFVEARKSLRDISKGEKAVKFFKEEVDMETHSTSNESRNGSKTKLSS